MTPKQKSQHITTIRSIIAENGLTEDRWGNYKFRSSGTTYRIKLMTNNCRCERKIAGIDGRWITVWSIPIIRLTIDQLVSWLKAHPSDK